MIIRMLSAALCACAWIAIFAVLVLAWDFAFDNGSLLDQMMQDRIWRSFHRHT